jgi:DNA replication protein DnaC
LPWSGLLKALLEQPPLPEIDAFGFEERLGRLADRELTEREPRRRLTRLRQARLRQAACLEDIDYRTPRGLDQALIQPLATGQWRRDPLNGLIVGPTGVGKTWIGGALAQAACRLGFTAAYHRLPRLLEDLALAHGDGRFPKLLAALAKTDLLVLDDGGLAPLTADPRRDLLERLDDRHARRSTRVTSQLPVDHWQAYLGDPTLADAILDRLVHNAYRLHLKGESLRKTRTPLTATPVSA